MFNLVSLLSAVAAIYKCMVSPTRYQLVPRIEAGAPLPLYVLPSFSLVACRCFLIIFCLTFFFNVSIKSKRLLSKIMTHWQGVASWKRLRVLNSIDQLNKSTIYLQKMITSDNIQYLLATCWNITCLITQEGVISLKFYINCS